MKTNNKVTKIKSIDFIFLNHSNFEKLPKKTRKLVSHLPNIKSADGYLLGQKEDGVYLSVIPYFFEYFPHEDKLSFHISFLSNKAPYLCTQSILYSYILLCVKSHKNKLISRHSINELDTLLMALDLGFKVVEFSKYSSPHIIIEKSFLVNKNITKEKEYITAFNKNYPNKIIRKINTQTSSKDSENFIKSKISNSISNLKAFSRFLDIDYSQFPITFEQLDKLCRMQKNISGTRIGYADNSYYFIEKNHTIGALMSPKYHATRGALKSISKTLLRSKSKIIYTNVHDDWVDSVFFLSGFVLASSNNYQKGLLWKWESLEQTKR